MDLEDRATRLLLEKEYRRVKHDLKFLSQAAGQVRKPLTEIEKTQDKRDCGRIVIDSVLNGKSWRQLLKSGPEFTSRLELPKGGMPC